MKPERVKVMVLLLLWILSGIAGTASMERVCLAAGANNGPETNGCLVAHWNLDETDGNTAEDSVGDNDGTLYDDPQWQPYSGRVDGALAFDGNDYVNCGNSPVFNITEQITVAAWVNINTVDKNWQAIVTKGDSAWRLSTYRRQRRFHFSVTGLPWHGVNGNIEVDPNEWHHVCGTYDGVNMRLYIDGVEDPCSPVADINGITTNSYDVLIGENQEKRGRYWDGLIDDVRIYNCPLPAAEVDELYRWAPFYVDGDATGANNGLTWADAFNYVQDALAIVPGGSRIHAAEGTYKPDQGAGITPGNRTATFQLIDSVTIKGSYAGFGEPSPKVRDFNEYETILSGDLGGNDGPQFTNNAENSYHVVTGSATDATAVLDGFTITAGNADRLGGGGMRNLSGSPTIANCTFSSNTADWGGGVFCVDSSPTLLNCTIRSNSASERGGGMASWEGGSPKLINCIFNSNSAGQWSGGLDNEEDSPTLTNCTFSGNSAPNAGGICNSNGNPTLVNCIFWGNRDNSFDMESAQIRNESGTLLVKYSCIEGWTGGLGGTANIGADPLFEDAEGADNVVGTKDDNLRPASSSPCIDAGDNAAVPPTALTDIEGKERILQGIVDIGAYEFLNLTYIYVNSVNGSDQYNGLSPKTPCLTIKKGIELAEHGFTVLVYPGVYQEPNGIDFSEKAITVTGVHDAPVLEAPDKYAVSFHGGEDANSVLKNFVIRNSFGGILVEGSWPKITNVTIVGNEYGVVKYTWADPDISNCIFWHNNTADLFECEARYSCIERKDEGEGEGNISTNPLFVDAAGGDYHLHSERGRYRATTNEWILDNVTSPCVDAGDPTVNPSKERMPNGGRLNMGAYGGTRYASMSEWKISGDVNRDGVVNMTDFAIVAGNWLDAAQWAQ